MRQMKLDGGDQPVEICDMKNEPAIDISLLRLKDARDLAPLIANYAQALKRGAPRRPDQFYAERLLQDRTAELLGARIDGALVGFCIFYDLPEPVSGQRCGMTDHVYVHHDYRGRGIAKAMIDVLADQGEERGWAKLMLNAPRRPEDGRKLYEQIAAPADWTSYIIRYDQ
jgi:GNAT superfamily N-acetyltransferase